MQKKTRLIDLSIKIEPAPGPEHQLLQIKHEAHHETAEYMMKRFQCRREDLPKGLGWANDYVTLGTHVGSKAVRWFIEKEQPPLTLHGHIHESPKMSGSWKDKIGNTICINVGSSYPEDKLNCVIIDLDNLDNIEYFELE